MSFGYDFIPLLRGDLFRVFDHLGYGLLLSLLLSYNILENLDLNIYSIVSFILRNSKYLLDFEDFKEDKYLVHVLLTLHF